MLSLLWQIFGIIFNVAIGQILKINLTIWSHWTEKGGLGIESFSECTEVSAFTFATDRRLVSTDQRIFEGISIDFFC